MHEYLLVHNAFREKRTRNLKLTWNRHEKDKCCGSQQPCYIARVHQVLSDVFICSVLENPDSLVEIQDETPYAWNILKMAYVCCMHRSKASEIMSLTTGSSWNCSGA